MQTMPAFVYLLPAIFFFNIGVVPGVVASVIFSMPPTIRLTMLGNRASTERFNRSDRSLWFDNVAKIMENPNSTRQTDNYGRVSTKVLCLSLSMVVIASMVGAPGLGEEVYRAVTQLKTGVGFETGLAIVIVAIILDRITQHAGKKKQGGTNNMKLTKKVIGLGAVALLAVGLAACGNDDGNDETSTGTDTTKSVG